MGRTTHRLLTLGVGVAGGGGLYWVLGAPVLSAVFGTTTAIGVGLVFRVERQYPGYLTGEGWVDGRWAGLASGLAAAGALLGVSPLLEITVELRLGLSLLVLVTAFTAFTAGYLAVLDHPDVHTGAGEEK